MYSIKYKSFFKVFFRNYIIYILLIICHNMYFIVDCVSYSNYLYLIIFYKYFKKYSHACGVAC
jgi:hypothetical protein